MRLPIPHSFVCNNQVLNTTEIAIHASPEVYDNCNL
jgi:hypothetical protein